VVSNEIVSIMTGSDLPCGGGEPEIVEKLKAGP
jgi:hypothetical protein